MDIHETARKGFQQGPAYDAYRPSYSDETIDFVLDLVRKVEILPQQENNIKYDIVELGAGTGKFSRKLLSKIKQERFLATEPLEGFLETLKGQSPGVETLQCAANDIPLPDKSVKAFICAQSFHWFANVKSLTEINRVLVPNGILVLVWNRKDQDVPWVNEFYKKIESYKGDNPPPQYNDMKWKEVFHQVTSIQYVQDYRLQGVKFEGPMDFVLNNACSVSYMNNLEDEKKKLAREELKKILLKQHKESATIVVPHFTSLYLYKKIN
ncbi:hypothetical protein SNE40_018853 [Patella caerulea]|uniref:Methyltransferase type 11 domain-containing protein n=1 Tax=Patella caerulea TaxID=87958 RepID=A0AAN8J7C9_PATCE